MARAERVDVSKEELYKIFDQNIVLADAKPGALWAYDKADRGKYKKKTGLAEGLQGEGHPARYIFTHQRVDGQSAALLTDPRFLAARQ